MAVKQVDVRKAWGLSKQRISQMVADGMPLSSMAEAEAWRVAKYGSRGRKIFKASTKKKAGGFDGEVPDELTQRPDPVKAEDLKREDFVGTLARLKKNELVAWGMLVAAVNEKNEMEIQVRLRHYRDAVDLRVRQEGAVDEILMNRRELVTLAEAEELFGRHLHALRLTLKNMPSRLAARCNPSDPTLAKQALNEAVDNVFRQMNEWDF